MAGMLMLFDSTVPWDDARVRSAMPVMASMAGATVGFIDNAKPNLFDLVDDLAQLLVARHDVARVVGRKKTAASIPFSPGTT